MAKELRLSGSDVDFYLESGEGLEPLTDMLSALVEEMKDSPGDVNETISIVIVNDFEPEEDEDESTDEETEPTKEA